MDALICLEANGSDGASFRFLAKLSFSFASVWRLIPFWSE